MESRRAEGKKPPVMMPASVRIPAAYRLGRRFTIAMSLGIALAGGAMAADAPARRRAPDEPPLQAPFARARLVAAPDQPVKVLQVILADGRTPEGGLVIEIENGSPMAIRSVEFLLAPADVCPRPGHPAALPVTYGRPNGEASQGDVPLLPPKGRARLTVASSSVRAIRTYHEHALCPPTAQPDLVLRKVHFEDGSRWEGFADGPGHAQWSGRTIAPGR